MLGVARGIVVGTTSGMGVSGLPEEFTAIGQGYIGPVPIPVIVMVVVAIVVGLFLAYHLWGTYIFSIGGNETAAILTGLPVARVKIFVYVACGLLAGLAGVLVVSRVGVSLPGQSLGYELQVIAAAVIGGVSLTGGRGTVLGAVLGAMIIGLIQNALVLLQVPPYWQQAFIGGIIILAAVVDIVRQRRRGIAGASTAQSRKEVRTEPSHAVNLPSNRIATGGPTREPALSREEVPAGVGRDDGAALASPAVLAGPSRAHRTRSSSSCGRPRRPTTRSSPSPSRAARSAPRSSATSSSCGSAHRTPTPSCRPTCSTRPSPPAATAWASPATTPPCCMPIIDRATAAGIPVITWDSDSPDSTRLSFYSIDGDAAATAGANVFVEAMADNPTKTYVLLSGNAGAPNLEGRIKAVRAVLDTTDLEYVTTLFCNDDPVLGATLIEDQLTAMPDLGGIFFIGGWPLFGDVNAMPQFLAATAAGTLKAVSWDTLSMQLPLLENGTVQGLIGQKYFGWGYDGIGIMYDHVKHGIALPPFTTSSCMPMPGSPSRWRDKALDRPFSKDQRKLHRERVPGHGLQRARRRGGEELRHGIDVTEVPAADEEDAAQVRHGCQLVLDERGAQHRVVIAEEGGHVLEVRRVEDGPDGRDATLEGRCARVAREQHVRLAGPPWHPRRRWHRPWPPRRRRCCRRRGAWNPASRSPT